MKKYTKKIPKGYGDDKDFAPKSSIRNIEGKSGDIRSYMPTSRKRRLRTTLKKSARQENKQITIKEEINSFIYD